MFKVVLSNKAEKSLRSYRAHRRRILDLLVMLQENPVPAEFYDVKRIGGRSDSYRVRLGDLRVVYDVDWDGRRVLVLKMLPRGSVYKSS